MTLTRRGRAVAYAALFGAAFLTGLALPVPNSALCAQSCTPIERHP